MGSTSGWNMRCRVEDATLLTQRRKRVRILQAGAIEAESELRGGEIVPDAAGGLHLKDAALIRLEKIASIGDAVVGCRLDGAARPAGRTHTSTVLLHLGDEVDAVFHSVLDACRAGRY